MVRNSCNKKVPYITGAIEEFLYDPDKIVAAPFYCNTFLKGRFQANTI
jgi:hypothetical protein